MRLWVPAVPHTVSHPDYVACAYTQKVVKFCRMMTALGYEVHHLGHEHSQVQALHHTVTDNEVLAVSYGDHDWRRHQFRHNCADWAYQEFNRRARAVLEAQAAPGDFLCLPFGIAHAPLADWAQRSGLRVCETGIGYTTGHIPGSWRAYESHAVRNWVERTNTQNWYSRVIPNYFDPADFDYNEQKQPWVLYLGRVTELKGITTCIQATAAAGVELKIAGQGCLSDLGYTTVPSHVTELGYADAELRRGLMSRASALIVASTYLEPFGGVQVEAMLSGTPVITPFFGAFAEVNLHGHTGYHCHTLAEFVTAVERRWEIDPADCRARGMQYSLDQVAPQFDSWFQAIDSVYTGAGWRQL
jgi:glycosyltransferase involved in cell wall biosynthesis